MYTNVRNVAKPMFEREELRDPYTRLCSKSRDNFKGGTSTTRPCGRTSTTASTSALICGQGRLGVDTLFAILSGLAVLRVSSNECAGCRLNTKYADERLGAVGRGKEPYQGVRLGRESYCTRVALRSCPLRPPSK